MDMQTMINLAITGDQATTNGNASVTQGFSVQSACDVSHQGVPALASGTLLLPATGDSQDICLGGVAKASGLLVSVNGATSLTINGTNVLKLRPAFGAAQAAAYLAADVTSASLASDTTSQDVDAVYQVWGAGETP